MTRYRCTLSSANFAFTQADDLELGREGAGVGLLMGVFPDMDLPEAQRALKLYRGGLLVRTAANEIEMPD